MHDYACMHVCMKCRYACVCMCMHVYARVCTCMHVYARVCTCMHVYARVCTCMHVCVCMCVCMYVCIYVYMYICIYVYVDVLSIVIAANWFKLVPILSNSKPFVWAAIPCLMPCSYGPQQVRELCGFALLSLLWHDLLVPMLSN